MELFFGIDLGTSNSAIACYDGSELTVIPNSRSDENTPSIVRFTENNVVVGAKAKNFLFKDPIHTHKEFKRLMGTQVKTTLDNFGHQYTAEQLSAEVLKALRNDALKFKDCAPENIIITVPALFELPQSNATAEAGRLAGFKKVELIPEPVASALAAGWKEQNATQAWLVFDLGGGTFDVSLVEARDGLLRVVAHDGDNFLGGRDIDRLLVNWLLNKLKDQKSITINPENPNHQAILRHLYQEVENAKIRLSTQDRTSIELDFEWDDDTIEIDFLLTRQELETLIEPIINRTIEICLRLITQQGIQQQQLGRVVLVGGPAHMPIIKKRVAKELAPIAEGNSDPMTLVARGAALYAATIGLKNIATQTAIAPQTIKDACELWIQSPSVCSDLQPDIMGRILNAKHFSPTSIQIIRDDGLWQSDKLAFDNNGVFLTNVDLVGAKNNSFTLKVFDKQGETIATIPEKISIVHGISISDPPLSRSISVALANGYTRTFIQRGSALPAKRSFIQHTTETLVPGSSQQLNIPIVQGERHFARFCRKVGNLRIDAQSLQQQLPAGSPIEISIEVDRGGNLHASALIIDHKKLISGVAELIMPNADPAVLQQNYTNIQTRLMQLQREAFAQRDQEAIITLDKLTQRLGHLSNDLLVAKNDQDAALRTQRNLLEVEADLEAFESKDQLEELRLECEQTYFHTREEVETYGNDIEKNMLKDCERRLEKALNFKRTQEIERLIEQMNKLYHAANRRNPDYWYDQFYYISARAHDAKDLKKATKLVEEGRIYLAQKNSAQLETCVRQLWSLIPSAIASSEENHGSGIQ